MIYIFFFSKEKIEYQLDGVYPAPNFFKVNKSTGQIVLIKRLREDVLQTSRYTVSRLIVLRVLIFIS